MAGYSGTPLPVKLGIKEGHRVRIVGAPETFTLDAPLADEGPYDVILAFCPDFATLADGFPAWKSQLTPAGGLWIGWPKKSSGLRTDLTETQVREYGLAGGLVDNKVCAIDETWSGLRFVTRLADRIPAKRP
jgi:hypothetical protein